MEIKNIFSKNTQTAFESAKQGIKKKFKPVVDVAQEAGAAIKQEFSPVVEKATNLATNIAKPIVEPIQQGRQKTQAIGEINTFFSDAGITLDDIKALAEDEGIDPTEVVSKFQRNGIKVQGMEELQAQEQKKVEEEANKPFQLDVNPEYDEVTALSRLTGAIPKFQAVPGENVGMGVAKMIGNLPSSALQMAGGVGDIGLSYLRNLDQGPIDAFTETAKAKIVNPTIAQGQNIVNTAKEGYQKGLETPYSWAEGGEAKKRGAFGGVLGATDALTQLGTEFIVENPVGAIMTGKSLGGVKRGGQALKTAGQEAMKGNIGKATTGLAKSTGIGLKENIYDPIKMGVTAPITAVKLGAKGIGAIAKKTGIKAPEGVKNISNNMAEKMLASQWKLTKPIRKELEGKIGQSGPKFALENDLVGKDIESTADNAGVFKIDKIKEKIEAVKKFGQTETPSVAKNVAQVLKSDIESSVQKSYGKKNTQKVLDENHPELANVYRLANEIMNSDKIDFVKLEQLKELHDYLNPENIQYDISGKPISETRNILSAGKRQKLQQILEAEGQKRGIDIKKINRDIQGAYTLEKGLNDTVGRIANLNILGLGDTQTAVISSILGGAPGAVGGILLKKGLTSEGFVGGLAKSLYSKKDVTTNNSNPSGTMTPPITRLGRIMNNSSDTVTPKVEPKGVTPKVVKPSSTTPTKPKDSIVTPKKKEVTPIVKKEVKKTDITGIEKEIETARKAIEMDKSIVKESARDDYVIFTKKGGTKENEGIKRVMQLKDFTNGRDGGLMKGYGPTDGNILAIVRKDGSVEYPKSPSPKPIVKNLQKTEKSGTIGDMETKKLIEEASKTDATGPRVLGKMGKIIKKTLTKSPTSFEEGMRRPFTLQNNKPIVKRATDIDSGVMDFNKAMRDEMSNTKRTPPSKEEYSVTATLKKIKEDLKNAKSKKEILDTTLAIDSYIKRGLDSTAYPESVMNIANKLHDMARAKRNTVMEKIDTNGLNNAIKEMEDRLSVYKQKGLQGKMIENYKDQISALKILKSHAESPGDYGLYEITSENTFKKDLSNTLSYMKKRFEDRAFGIDPFIDRQMKQIKEYYTRK